MKAMVRHQKGFALMILVFLRLITFGQNKISGKISDSTTGAELSFVNVFFVNTTLGTSTNADGTYAFTGFPSGKYDLIVSLVGYKRQQRVIEFTGQTQLTVDFQLEQDPIQLSEVTVKEDTTNREKYYQQFKSRFLGRSDYSQKAMILNPQDIHLYFDKQTSTLIAHAKKPIQVVCKATGYRISYYLEHFEYHFGKGLLNLYGFPLFESLVPENEREKRKWEKERAKVYQGSLMHFIRSWKENKLTQEGFKVSRVYKVPNSKRPSEEYLQGKIAALNSKLPNGSKQNKDSLFYYKRLRSLPMDVDSIVNESLTGQELLDVKKEVMKFIGVLEVEYQKKEELSYAHYSGRDFTVNQKSRLHIASPLRLYQNGYFEDVHDLLLEKYWSWIENTSTLLPLDYDLPTHAK